MNKMNKKTDKIDRQSAKRRKVLKNTVIASGAIAAAKTVPANWSKPVVDAILLPAHAQTTPTNGTTTGATTGATTGTTVPPATTALPPATTALPPATTALPPATTATPTTTATPIPACGFAIEIISWNVDFALAAPGPTVTQGEAGTMKIKITPPPPDGGSIGVDTYVDGVLHESIASGRGFFLADGFAFQRVLVSSDFSTGSVEMRFYYASCTTSIYYLTSKV